MSHLESPLHNLSIKSMLAANSRLWGSCEADAHHGPQEQEPGVHWGKGTQQPKVQSPGHGHHQTLNQSPQSGRGTDEAHSKITEGRARTHKPSAIFVGQVPPHGGADAHPGKHHLGETPKNFSLWLGERSLRC